MNRSRVKVLTAAVGATLLLAGCSGGTTAASAGSSSQDRGVVAPQPAAGAKGEGDAPAGTRVDAAAADPASLGGRRQVRTADLGLQVDDLRVAAAQVRALATAAKGYVQAEKTSTDPVPVPLPADADRGVSTPQPSGQSVLTVRVPEPGLDRLMDQVALLGDQVSRGQSSDDVTDRFVDVASRLRTQRASVARVRVLLDRATTIGQVVQVESELTRRQADLESLEARLAALTDQSTLATLTVSLSPVRAAAKTQVAPGAFVEGLRGGWQAMLASVAVALRVLGALLPFAVLAALVGVPVMVLMRRRGTQQSV